MKLNFGSARDRIKEFTNVDAMDWIGNTDVIHDMNEFPYPFDSNTIEEVRSVENLEHISFKKTQLVLREFCRILKPGGKLHIQVPDCGKAMEYYVNKQICECVKHKPMSEAETRGKPGCPVCEGKAMINPNRWLLSFLGAQKHPYDAHLAIFTRSIMLDQLAGAGFREIEFVNDKNGWKLKVNANKPYEEK